MKYSLTLKGVLVMILGTALVDSLGFTESCATELTAKVLEYAPLLIGGVMAWVGRARLGGVDKFGFKN